MVRCYLQLKFIRFLLVNALYAYIYLLVVNADKGSPYPRRSEEHHQVSQGAILRYPRLFVFRS